MNLKLIKFHCVRSTNDEAIKIIKSRRNKQGIIISNQQTKGKHKGTQRETAQSISWAGQ